MGRSGITICLLLVLAAPAGAATYHVNAEGTGDFPDIASAIAAAAPGDSIRLASGIYTGLLNTALDFQGKDIVLSGAGVDSTILDCQDHGEPVVRFASGETAAAVLSDMTLRNNYHFYHSPGVTIDAASPTLQRLQLEDFDGVIGNGLFNNYSGAAIHIRDGSPLVTEVNVTDCRGAGGIYASGGAPIFSVVEVAGCLNGYARGGGCSFLRTAAILTQVTVVDCESFGGGGGAVSCSYSPAPSFTECRFEGNVASSEAGGAIGGGAIACFSSSPTIQRCDLIDNHGRDGGGALAFFDGSSPLIEDAVIARSSTDDLGSALFISESSPSFLRVTIADSEGAGVGGTDAVIHCDGVSNPQFDQCIIAFGEGSAGIVTDADCTVNLNCCDIFGFEGGPFSGAMPDVIGHDGNISFDPLFCRDAGGEAAYALGGLSRCLPANNSCGLLMGARGEGCSLEAHWMAGQVADADGHGIPGVRMNGLPGYVETNADGVYFSMIPATGPLVVRPQIPGFAFTPPERSYDPFDQDFPNQNYAAYEVTLVHVPEDYPTIYSAIANVADGDTVLVAPGVYSGSGFDNLTFQGKDLVLMSSAGPDSTIIEESSIHAIISFYSGATRASKVQGFTFRHTGSLNAQNHAIYVNDASPTLADLRIVGFTAYSSGGLYIQGAASDVLVENSVFARNRAKFYSGGAIHCSAGALTLDNVTVALNSAGTRGGGISVGYGGALTMNHCIVAFNENGGVASDGTASIALDCNDLYSNSGGNLQGLIEPPVGLDTTFSADPIFCAPLDDAFTLNAASPCLAASSPCGVLVGALGEACAFPVVSIAGKMADVGGLGIADVHVSGLDLPCYSDSLGDYHAVVPSGWSGTLRPQLPGHGFLPRFRDYESIEADQWDQNFEGFAESVHRVPSDYPKIQVAIDACAPGDTVLLASGTFTGPGNVGLVIESVNLVLRSEAGASVTVIDGEGVHQGLQCNGEEIDSTTVIEGLTLRNCAAPDVGGGLQIFSGWPVLRHLVLENCSAEDHGGAIYATGPTLVLDHVSILESHAGSHGGALLLSICEAQVRDCVFAGNTAMKGGAVYSYEGSLSHAEVLFERCTFADNAATQGGGLYTYAGLDSDSGLMPRLQACIFAGNSADEGGAIYARYEVADSTRIACNDFFDNLPDNCAGGLADQVGATGNIGEDPLFCDAEAGDFTLASNSPCLPDGNGCGLRMGAFEVGCTAVAVDESIPAAFALSSPFPNPFNPRTEIAFELPAPARVDLAIYDVTGRLAVRILDGEAYPAGHHRLTWAGRGAGGQRLASGVYFVRLRAAGNKAEAKLVRLK